MTAQNSTTQNSTAQNPLETEQESTAQRPHPAGSLKVVSAPTTHLRITRRGRAVLATLGALPIVAGAFVFGLNGGGAVASADQSSVEFQYVTVRAGESLWSLAEELAPESDPRDVVDDILSLNQLPSAGIEPGQRLAVPSQYDVVR